MIDCDFCSSFEPIVSIFEQTILEMLQQIMSCSRLYLKYKQSGRYRMEFVDIRACAITVRELALASAYVIKWEKPWTNYCLYNANSLSLIMVWRDSYCFPTETKCVSQFSILPQQWNDMIFTDNEYVLQAAS